MRFPPAITNNFTSIVAQQTTIHKTDFDEIRDAINEVFTITNANFVPLGWATIAPGVPAPAVDGAVRKEHLLGLRNYMTQALQSFGITPNYTDPTIDTSTPIRAQHIIDLQRAAN